MIRHIGIIDEKVGCTTVVPSRLDVLDSEATDDTVLIGFDRRRCCDELQVSFRLQSGFFLLSERVRLM